MTEIGARPLGAGADPRAQRHSLLAEIYRAIVRASDGIEMFQRACKIAVERGGFLMAWVGAVDRDLRVTPVASYGAEEGYLGTVDVSARNSPAGQGPTGTAIRTGEHVICADIEHDPRMAPWRDRALARGYRSSGAFPMLIGGRVIGTINVYAAVVGFAPPRVIQLLDDIAADMSFALEGFDREERRREAEEALRRSEERFRDAVESLLDGFATFDPVRDDGGRIVDLRYTYINQAGCDLNQRAREDTLGRTVLELLPGHAGAGLIDAYAKVIETGEPLAQEALEYEDLYGGRHLTRAFDFRATRVGDGLVVSWRDVTTRLRAERTLLELNERLERSNEALQEFAYVASHDLSEPLRTVTGFVQLLERRYRGRLDAEADEFISFAVDGCTRMQALIDGLLTYSRVTTRAEPWMLVDSGDVLRHVVDLLAARIAETGTTIEVGDMPRVVADRMQLSQLFQNLLTNAMKFVAPGTAPWVRVDTTRTADGWLFAVADHGIGVDPRQRDRLFRMFSRLHGHDEYAGSGIGLAVCRKIVERHGGRIWHEDNEGGGSRFCFTLPDREVEP